jgi:hypothetical protein
MGGTRQLYFFHLNEDIDKLLEYFNQNEILIVPHLIYKLNDMEPYSLFEEFKNEHLVQIIFKDKLQNLTYEYIEKQNYFLCNSEQSNCIELKLSHTNSLGFLECGIFTYSEQFYLNGSYYFHDKEVIKRYANFYKYFKKTNLQPHKTAKGWYVTNAVADMVEKGQIKLLF